MAGLGVILDVVYNHLGPDGNYLGQFAPDYFTTRYRTDWGAAINFDGPGSGPVREFFVANAGYWIEEFHLDGFRFDATQDIHDDSPEHILSAIARRARAQAGPRTVFLVAENEPQDVRLVRPVRGRRLRARCPLERRLPSQRHGRPDGAGRGVLRRLRRYPAGAHLGGQARLPLPGPAVCVAGEAAGNARRGTSHRPRS